MKIILCLLMLSAWPLAAWSSARVRTVVAHPHLALARDVLHQTRDELHGRQQPLSSPDIAGIRVIAKNRLQASVQASTHVRGVLTQLLTLHDVEVRADDPQWRAGAVT